MNVDESRSSAGGHSSGVTGYRPDIDGLRAVAVLAVLAYHAFPDALPGGYTGVDVFFVISGYLISGIILGDLKRGRFTFAGFYARRIRRIFPALVLVLAFAIIVGWQILLPADFERLGRHVVAGAAFLANIALYREAGYFDTASELKPLLHLWSLGVEEQYYLVWPLLLFLVRRHAHRIFWMILAIALASYVLNVIVTPRAPTAAFYLPATRFWELMVGGLAAYVRVYGQPTPVAAALRQVTRGSWSPVVGAAGVLLLVAGLVFLSPETTFPGSWALLPTAGTLLLVVNGPGGWINQHVLSRRWIVYIGLISYPLYLWHWPLLVYARIMYDGSEPPVALRLGLLIVSALLSVATYELVEKRIRLAHRTGWAAAAVTGAAVCMVAVAVAGAFVAKGHPAAHAAGSPLVAEITAAKRDWEGIGNQVIPGNSPRAVLFFGDSHMQQYLPRIARIAQERRQPVRTVMTHTLEGCAPFPGVDRLGLPCDEFVRQGFSLAHRDDVDVVVISASWAGFASRQDLRRHGDEGGPLVHPLDPSSSWLLDGLEEALQDLSHDGKQLVIVASSPRGDAFDPRRRVIHSGISIVAAPDRPISRAEVEANIGPIDSRIRDIAHRVGAIVIDPLEWACPGGDCPVVDAQGKPLYLDPSHFRASVIRDRFDLLDKFVCLDP